MGQGVSVVDSVAETDSRASDDGKNTPTLDRRGSCASVSSVELDQRRAEAQNESETHDGEPTTPEHASIELPEPLALAHVEEVSRLMVILPGSTYVDRERALDALVRLASATPIHRFGDESPEATWRALVDALRGGALRCDEPLSSETEDGASQWCAALATNTLHSANFGQLLLVAAHGLQRVCAGVRANQLLASVVDTLSLVRLVAQFLTRYAPDPTGLLVRFSSIAPNGGQERMVSALSGQEGSGIAVARALVEALTRCVVSLPCNGDTYALHCECAALLVVLCSTQMFSSPHLLTHLSAHPVLQLVVQDTLSPKLLQVLLGRVATQEPSMLGAVPLRRRFMSMFSYSTVDVDAQSERPGMSHLKQAPLAQLSLLLVLVLVQHQPRGNRYELLLASAQNAERDSSHDASLTSDEDADGRSANAAMTIVVPFSILFGALIDNFTVEDPCVLLFYHLLVRNDTFRYYVLARTDLETPLLPLLHLLHVADLRHPHTIYLALAVALVLSSDQLFIQNLSNLALPSVPDWFTERTLHDISLADLTLLVLTRVVQMCVGRFHDTYALSLAMSVIGNIAPRCVELHAYTAQRVVRLVRVLLRHYTRCLARVSQRSSPKLSNSNSETSEPRTHTPPKHGMKRASSRTDLQSIPPNAKRNMPSANEAQLSMLQQAAVYEQFLHVALDAIQSMLRAGMSRNRELLYELLYNMDVFSEAASHPRLESSCDWITTILDHIHESLYPESGSSTTRRNARVTSVSSDEVSAAVARLAEPARPQVANESHQFSRVEVLQLIDRATRTLPVHGVDSFFTYEFEEDASGHDSRHEFLTPHTWLVVYVYSGLWCSSDYVRLFGTPILDSPPPPSQPTAAGTAADD